MWHECIWIWNATWSLEEIIPCQSNAFFIKSCNSIKLIISSIFDYGCYYCIIGNFIFITMCREFTHTNAGSFCEAASPYAAHLCNRMQIWGTCQFGSDFGWTVSWQRYSRRSFAYSVGKHFLLTLPGRLENDEIGLGWGYSQRHGSVPDRVRKRNTRASKRGKIEDLDVCLCPIFFF